MSDLEHARLMLDAARRDLAAVAGMADACVFAEEIFGFHAQQAVEKALKGWLSLAGVLYPRTHDLEQLFAMLAESGQAVPDPFRSLTDLTDFAVALRYEAFEQDAERLDRSAVTRQVRDFLTWVEKLEQRAASSQ